MSSINKRQFIFLQVLLALIITVASCNSKSEDNERDIVVTYSTVAVKNFYIQANDSVMAHIDSVFFSIDLNTGVIFNADSLPKGTKVSRLIPSITFANSVSKAELSFKKDNKTDTVVDYLTNPTDSIDFSQPVLLNVTAADGENSFTYQIKVNVHLQEPDSLIWNKIEVSTLPTTTGNATAQKTVISGETVYSMVEENDGSVTLWSSSDLNEGEWTELSFNPGFNPAVRSFTTSNNIFYLLDDKGDLYVSEDLSTWNSTGENWFKILGGYNNSILGLKQTNDGIYHVRYPSTGEGDMIPIETNFPISDTSALGLIETKWASRPMAILSGGVTQGGELSSNVWAFDGTTWSVINENYLPALESPMLARYVVYRATTSLFVKREFDVWLLFGGIREDNSMNRTVYMSYDNGVSWSPAPALMQLTDVVPDLRGADVIVAGYPLSADLSEAWTPTQSTKTRSSYVIEGYDITWMCPYMYIFGGFFTASDNSLNQYIYRGVLQRLEFTPDI